MHKLHNLIDRRILSRAGSLRQCQDNAGITDRDDGGWLAMVAALACRSWLARHVGVDSLHPWK
jgi:hypothetical protein